MLACKAQTAVAAAACVVVLVWLVLMLQCRESCWNGMGYAASQHAWKATLLNQHKPIAFILKAS
jgi:hypothetical protein